MKAIAAIRDPAWVLGCDCGVSGGLAIVNVEQQLLCDAMLMPVVNLAGTKFVDGARVIDWLKMHRGPSRIVIESPGNRKLGGPAVKGDPSDRGRRSLKTEAVISRMAGGIVSVLLTTGLPIEMVTPGAWKAAARLKGGDKRASLAMARAMFGNPDQLLRAKDEGVAEAALLAWFGGRHRGKMAA